MLKTRRNSSFELLRIILIVMILVEHGNMWFVGGGYSSEAEHFTKAFVESLCIGSVNAFVLISGWFGIRSGLKKIGDLAFMVFFCTIPLLIAALALGWLSLSELTTFNGIYEYIFGGHAYWFIVDYIGLLILSPVLNKGVDALDRRSFRNLLLAGYAIILIYDFIFRVPVLGSEGGYSVLWFLFLYMLGRYMHIHGLEFISRFRVSLLILTVALQTFLFYYGLIGMRYTNPLILLEAVCMISIFRKWHFHNSFINYAASGCLMAYMLHMQPVLVPFIRKFLVSEYRLHGYWIYMAEIVCLSVGVFAIAVLIDKAQAALYRKITK